MRDLCVQLARLGCIVWQWDMLGESDSLQLSHKLIHESAKPRPEMNTVENWGLFSPQAEAHLQSAMGLQTWNAIRSLDFLLSLPDVDPDRIAMTGASYRLRNRADAKTVGDSRPAQADAAPAAIEPVTLTTFDSCWRRTEMVDADPGLPVVAVFSIVT